MKQDLGIWDDIRYEENENNEKDVRYGGMPKAFRTYYKGFAIKVKKTPLIVEKRKNLIAANGILLKVKMIMYLRLKH